MTLEIEVASGIGFCFGVKRAVGILEKAARARGQVETLGAPVHNQQVLQRLADIGVRVVKDISDIEGNIVAIGTHGVGPQLRDKLRAQYEETIDTTCPFVHRAQLAARRLASSGFFVLIYGDANHPEVKGVLDWAEGKGAATVDGNFIATIKSSPRRLGILSQTTQIPAHFTEFVKKVLDATFVRDAELRIIDTICHDIRERQRVALELAHRVDLMLVIGSHTSANTNHLTKLCAMVTKTYLVETAAEVQPSQLQGYHRIGITSGASTPEQTIKEILAKLEARA